MVVLGGGARAREEHGRGMVNAPGLTSPSFPSPPAENSASQPVRLAFQRRTEPTMAAMASGIHTLKQLSDTGEIDLHLPSSRNDSQCIPLMVLVVSIARRAGKGRGFPASAAVLLQSTPGDSFWGAARSLALG